MKWNTSGIVLVVKQMVAFISSALQNKANNGGEKESKGLDQRTRRSCLFDWVRLVVSEGWEGGSREIITLFRDSIISCTEIVLVYISFRHLMVRNVLKLYHSANNS